MDTYDYIVVGAGAAGSVIAARLAQNRSNTVLLLESGHDNSKTSKIISASDHKLIATPSDAVGLVPRYHKEGGRLFASPTLSDYVTTKQNGARYYAYPRGNGAGGSTNHHNMIDGRGTPLVYDRIAQEVKDPIWSYQNILKYYIKMEDYQVPMANPKLHGKGGWLKIRQAGKLEHDLRKEIINAVKEEIGAPLNQDPADPAQVSGMHLPMEQVDQKGQRSYAYKDLLQPMLATYPNLCVKFNVLVKKLITRTIDDQLIAHGVNCYEKPHLSKVNVTGNWIDERGHAILPDRSDPIRTTYYAKKEIILCAGAIATPQILMLSGIGPKNHLESFGIHPILDLRGVGQNLMDHIESNLIYELDPEKIMWRWQATYMKYYTDYKRLASPRIRAMIEKYADHRSFSEVGAAMILDWGTDGKTMLAHRFPISSPITPFLEKTDQLAPAIVQTELTADKATLNQIAPVEKKIDPIIKSTLCTTDPSSHVIIFNAFNFDFNSDLHPFPRGDTLHLKEHKKDTYLPDPSDPMSPKGIRGLKQQCIESQTDPANPRVFLTFLTECMHIKATGSIQLKSLDPRDQPIIDLGLWSDQHAVGQIADMMIELRKVAHNSAISQYALKGHEFELVPGRHCKSRDDLIQYIKNWQSYGHHISGTAKMGHDDDEMAVVSSRLKVRGITGLRVIDSSIYPAPHLHAYNPSRGIYMMAEVAADFIKEEWADK